MLQINSVSKKYSASLIALSNISFTVNKGEMVFLTGSSGAGKSTLMNLIGCLDRPSTGKLFIDDTDVYTLGENDLARIRREKIGFIFQKYNLIPTLSALENVTLSMGFAGLNTNTRIKKAKQLLDMVELSHRINHKPSEL